MENTKIYVIPEHGVDGVEGVDSTVMEVNVAELTCVTVLASITDELRTFLDFSYDDRIYNFLGLWLAGTYVCNTAFKSYPQIFLEGAYLSGKSQTLEVCSYIAKDGELNSRITAPALRDLANQKRSLFLDEFE